MKFIDLSLENYCIRKSTTPSQVCNELEKYTKENISMSQMLIGKMEASLLGFLIRSNHVKNIVEFGTYTGYSALAMAEQLPNDGKVYTFDIDEENAKIAREFWSKSEHGNKITQIIGPALESIKEIDFEIDLAFIDADKGNYSNYLTETLKKLSHRGVIVVDNVLWSGKVLETAPKDESTRAIQALNNLVKDSPELYGTLLPVRDGMFLITKVKA